MAEQQSDRELALRSKAAEAFTYQRPDAAKKPVVDTSRLWTSVRMPSDPGKSSPDVPRDQGVIK